MHPATPPGPPQPTPADPASLSYPLTFFLTASERARVLRSLRAIHTDRSRALVEALRLPRAPRRRSAP